MKQFIQNFNNLIKKTIFKLQNKTNNKLKISTFNKYLITFISILFFYLFYLSIPTLYDRNWVQNTIEEQLLKDFKINFSLSSDISYRILPAPHFLIKNSKIFENTDNTVLLADIKNLKVFLNQKNFFNKEKLALKYVEANYANFSLSRSNFKLLNDAIDSKFSKKKIKINNSNIFFKNDLNETITSIKISKALLFYDPSSLLNLLNLKGEVFKIPFIFDFNEKFDSFENKQINIDAEMLKLNIFNNFSDEGKNVISFLNSKIYTNYRIKDGTVLFNSDDSKIKNNITEYSGELSVEPFNFNLNVDLGNYKLSKLLNFKSTLTEFVKTELFFNNNISSNITIITKPKAKEEIFQNVKINFTIIDGQINFNKTRLINNKIGSLELEKSNLFFDNDKLILNMDVVIDIDNTDKLFSLLQTSKKSRKPVKNILINLNYYFTSNQFEFNNIKIDNKEASQELVRIIEGFNDNNYNNLNNSRRLLNAIFEAYDG